MRKLVAFTLAGALVLGAVSPALAKGNDSKSSGGRFGAEFKDWKTDFWGNESLSRMIVKGVMKGDGNETISQDRPVTRLEAAIMLSRLLELSTPVKAGPDQQFTFPGGRVTVKQSNGKFEVRIDDKSGEVDIKDANDVPAWGRDAVLIGLQNDFMLLDGGKLNASAKLTRVEAAVMLVKAAGFDADAKAKAGTVLTFADASDIPANLVGYVAVAVDKGFIQGDETNHFNPKGTLTRAEWATMLDRLDRKQGPTESKDKRQIKGTVTAVTVGTTPSIAMTTSVYPGGVTYPVDDTAVFYKNGKPITIADIVAGDQVIVNLNADRKVVMVTVNNESHWLKGSVTAFTAPTATTPGSLTLTVDGNLQTVAVAADTVVLLADHPANLSDLLVGDKVGVLMEGTRVTKIAIVVAPREVEGTLTAMTPGTNLVLPTITVSGDQAGTFSVADAATIRSGDTAITLADLKVGNEVHLKVQRNVAVAIVRQSTDVTPAPAPAPTTGSN
jgi:hypothetical protein